MFEMTSGADWLIAGLGNPEPKYDGTRHNAGFEALDYLAAQWQCDIAKAKWQGLYGTAQVNGHKVVLLKPLTYMNLSGQSIAPAANFYKIPADHIDLAAWVLGKLPAADRKAMTDRYPDIEEACKLLMDDNLQYAQNKFNH